MIRQERTCLWQLAIEIFQMTKSLRVAASLARDRAVSSRDHHPLGAPTSWGDGVGKRLDGDENCERCNRVPSI
jgi:hypothetical protein